MEQHSIVPEKKGLFRLETNGLSIVEKSKCFKTGTGVLHYIKEGLAWHNREGQVMGKSFNSMDLFKVLPKTNCRECKASTCLAFSVLVFKGEKQPGECPYLSEEVIEQFGGTIKSSAAKIPDPYEALELLKKEILKVDLQKAAEKTGGVFSGDKLTLKILGKDFNIGTDGSLSSDIHINPWVVAPVLNYVLNCKGVPASGQWVPYRELEGGKNRYRLFEQRCEKALKKIADTYTDLFEDMLEIFNGRQVESHYESDISILLMPLPKIPILICYSKPDDGLDSELNLFFDSTAEENLTIDGLYGLGAGLVNMFEKLAVRHG